jgi:uncharacterized protein YhaN
MRIRKLGLRRYGLFTDGAIDFGERKAGHADLHIVYGPNEAGKSTAMSACMDLLFGIPAQSRFNFLHPYPSMRIEAEVEQDGRLRHVARIKRPQNSLLDDADRPIPDAILLGEIGGLDRSAYQTMFCLDDDTLETGGESILASKGDLGHLLFSATAGLADLSHRLGSAHAEADAFFRPGKRSGVLTDLKKELAALKDSRDQVDTLASEFSRLVIDRDQAGKDYDEALAQRGRTQARIDEIQRQLTALPRLVTFRNLRAELEPLSSLPEAPSGWVEELPDLMTRRTKLATQSHALADSAAGLQGLLDGLIVNDIACGLKGRSELLTELRARYVTAEKDLPERRVRLGLSEQMVERILSRIGRTSDDRPELFIISTAVTGPLRDLIERRSGVEAAVAAADAEASKARAAFAQAEAAISIVDRERDQTAMRALATTIGILRDSGVAERLRSADRMNQERSDEFVDRLLELRPWQGDRTALLALTAPTPERLEHWASAETKLSQDETLQRKESDRLTAELARLDSRIAALGSAAGVISDQEAGEIRSAREAAWAAHRAALDTATAASFESIMRKFDLVTEQRFGHMAGVAELNRALLDRAEIKTFLEQALRVLKNTVERRAEVAKEITESLSAIGSGFDEKIGVAGARLWLQKREQAIEASEKLTAAERDFRQLQTDVDSSRARLAKALGAAGVSFTHDDDIAAMIVAGEAALERDVEIRALRAALDDRRRDLELRESGREEVLQTEQAWNNGWRKACAACWLGEGGELPTTAMVKETLEAIAELGSVLEKKAELADRIAKMERDQDQFRAEVTELADLLGLALRPSDALGLCNAVMDAVTEATKVLDRRNDISARLLAEKDKARDLAEDLAIVHAQTSQMTTFFGVDTLTEVDSRLRAVARRSELTARLEEARGEILDAMRLKTIEETETQLDAMDRGSLEAELVEQKARFKDEDARSRDLFSARNKAEDRIGAVGGDAAVAAIDQKRRTILLTIEDRALAYLRLRLGAAAADRALRAYRDRHRSSMMARASESFSLISRGAYSELVTQPSNDSELLIAKGRDGSSKIASELSKGTRFQLYLALRVAGYHEFAQAHVPAPFLADDIMETFDDFRAEEAFRLLAGMAATGQVVYFTHHRHLCEIAKTVEPSVIIHDLQSGMRLAS